MKKQNSQRAFTTVEVITVLLIGIVVVATVISAMRAFRTNARIQAINADTVRQAGQCYALYLNPEATSFISGKVAILDGPDNNKVNITTTKTSLRASSTATEAGVLAYKVTTNGTITPE